ncbi:MAG TPA: Gfo/Idh/MocA family oxidoreductase [Sedimentisphaerales bacterium]|nr:Gfo/Idh/MocA family oxidoreductase [Sedimentisphaerales bacterium]HRV46803.1 Gfo/Idh/MocA family oxidoreductase [Sedimentisphaerales bacterium]
MDRRDFIKRAAGTVAAAAFPCVVPSSVFAQGGQTPPSERITLGFIGCGKQSQHLTRSFLNSPGTHVVAVCDVDKLKLARNKKIVEDHYANASGASYKGCDTYGDFRDLLARGDIDAVVISTPDHWHAINVIESCRAGKEIYCEKPLSQTVAEARAMVNAVREYDRVFQTGSMQRSDWHFRLGCELVRNGYIGQLQHITVGIGGPPEDRPLAAQPVPDYLDWDMWLGPVLWRPYNEELAPPISFDGFPNWRYHSEFGGGGMTDWGAHHFDIAQWGLGMDESGPVEIIPPDGKDYKVLTYRYANGVTMVRDSANGVLFTGTEGKVETNRGHLKTWPDELKDVKLRAEEIHLYESSNHYVDWLDAIRKRSKPICDIETGCRSVTVCHLGNIAYKLQRPLKWDPAREVFVGDDEANRLLSRAYRSPWRL